ncbi:MAG: hypothetical protein H7332_18445 [Bdellovibrionales bacterium]|nr:hypothetical protein [Ramlibacter sp.]
MLTLRRHRLFTVLVALASLLFMQLAVAGYACPGMAARGEARLQQAAAMPGTAHAGMPCAQAMGVSGASSAPTSMDAQQPALCHAYCHGGKQMSDGYHLELPAFAPEQGLAYLILPSVASALLDAPQAPLLARAAAPPLSIQHCCFRI